ncbi:MAG: hypothetical protein H6732_15360 [Alphaproteobacteria bacterium]|nr:hypothetical protein [Alphaproteobacteria bacterium]
MPADRPSPTSPWTGLATSLLSLVLSLAVAEGIVRLADGGAFAQLRAFAADAHDGVVMVEGAYAVRRPDGRHTTVTLGPHGLRRTPPSDGPTWLLLGDSQALGLGVADDEAMAAVATARGPVRVLPVAVPGYGVGDALRRAGSLLDALHPDGVLLLVNQANDWDEAGRPVETRYEVGGGWLLPRSAPAWARSFFATPLSGSHLLHHAVVVLAADLEAVPPVWTTDADATARATARLAADVQQFAAAHPGLPLRVAYLPLDATTSPERAAASPYAALLRGPTPDLLAALRTALPGHAVVDLTPALGDPSSFLEHDYHLSPEGHGRVAEVLVAALAEPSP